MTAPATGPADRSSGLLRLFLRLSTFAALPSRRCKQRPYGYAAQVGPIRPTSPVVANRFVFAALARSRGL